MIHDRVFSRYLRELCLSECLNYVHLVKKPTEGIDGIQLGPTWMVDGGNVLHVYPLLSPVSTIHMLLKWLCASRIHYHFRHAFNQVLHKYSAILFSFIGTHHSRTITEANG